MVFQAGGSGALAGQKLLKEFTAMVFGGVLHCHGVSGGSGVLAAQKL